MEWQSLQIGNAVEMFGQFLFGTLVEKKNCREKIIYNIYLICGRIRTRNDSCENIRRNGVVRY